MAVTIEQIKKDIENGTCKMIYYSSQTLWWCHTEFDLKEATVFGKENTKKRLTKLINDDKVLDSDKRMMREHLKNIDKSHIPTDPSGAPLFQLDDPIKWITEAEKKPDHFGEHKLEAFIFTHHQNHKGWTPKRWEDVNEYITRTKMLKGQRFG